MSHMMHRIGDGESLSYDYPILTKSNPKINGEGAMEKLQRFIAVAQKHHPVNLGVNECGSMYVSSPEEIAANMPGARTVNVVFDNREDFKGFLSELKETDWDLSVTTAGTLENIRSVCEELGIVPHSLCLSLGMWGNREKFPSDAVLPIITMCGHNQLSPQLVEKHIALLRSGKETPQTAAEELAKLCACGAFNVTRAKKHFEKILASEEENLL